MDNFPNPRLSADAGDDLVEREELWETWLYRATARLDTAAFEAGSPAVRNIGLWMLIAIEGGSAIEVPEVWARGEGSGRIRFLWARGGKHVSIDLDSDSRAEIQLWTKDELVAHEVFDLGWFENVRNALSWIFPEANASHRGL